MKHFISLGAGVQSSTMALMAAKGEITPMPEGAIFADTGWEPQGVYTWLDWLEKQLPFPVYREKKGDLGLDNLIVRRSKKSGKLYNNSKIPAYTKEFETGKQGMLPRKCTGDYKIQVILRGLRKQLGIKRIYKSRLTEPLVTQWIGISKDEAHRMKPSLEPWIVNIWPLIDLGMSREDCLTWMKDNGYPKPPRSACIFCPYHSDKEWMRLRDEEPLEFKRAVEWETKYIEAASRDEVIKGVPFVHASCVPLSQVVFRNDEKEVNKFGNECTGMCGV